MLREKVIQRAGSNGIHTLGRVLRIMDDSGDKSLDRSELKYGLLDFGIECTDDEVSDVFEYLDRDHSGKISFDEFLVGLRGPIAKRRVDLIRLAFQQLDRTKDGVVTLEDIEDVYDTSYHPDVRSGKLTHAEALRDFMAQWDTIEQDGIVTEEEFLEYYKNVSASIDNDDMFELMIRNSWRISGGSGWSENTANRRVLVTDESGKESVQEIQNDLWINRENEEEMRRRLEERGIKPVGKLGTHYATPNSKANSSGSFSRKKATPYGNSSSLSLAWEEPPSNKPVENKRERERTMRAGAARHVQAMARAHKARKQVQAMKRKQRAQEEIEHQVEYEREKEKSKIIRPKGKNWY